MSDDGFDDWDDYDVEGDNNGGSDDENVEIENNFYEAEDLMNSAPEEALEKFESVILMEENIEGEKQKTFDSLTNIVILCSRMNQEEKMIKSHEKLLKMMDKVAPNDAHSSINNILDALADSNIGQRVYEMTLDVLEKGTNERLWFSTSIKLARVYLENKETSKLPPIIEKLKATCRLPDGNDDPKKAQNLLEIYALEIQLCTITKDTKKSKMIYSKTINLNAAVADPRILSVIKESGGKMYMSEKNWEEALAEFNDSFKHYQEIGHPRAKDVLKYVVLASILSGSSINPFDSREAKVYQNDEEIGAMMSLRDSYEANDINKINYLINNKKYRILEDAFIREYLDDLLKNIRLNILEAKIRPYKTINLKFLAREIKISDDEVNALVVELILDEKIQGQIDQVNGYLEVNAVDQGNSQFRKHKAIQKWAHSLSAFHTHLVEKVK